MNKLKEISEERINEISSILDKNSDEIEDVPRIILAAATIKEHGCGWIHNEIKATSIELFIMFVELLKQNPNTIDVIEKAIEWVKLEGAHGSEFMKLIDNNMKKVVDTARGENNDSEVLGPNPDMLEALKQELKETGNTTDVDNLLDEILGKKDDKEGDKQE